MFIMLDWTSLEHITFFFYIFYLLKTLKKRTKALTNAVKLEPSVVVFPLTDEVVHQKCWCLAVFCGKQLPLWCWVRKGDFFFGQMAPVHERVPESVRNNSFIYIKQFMLTPTIRSFILLMHWKCLVPDSVQKASGDALPPHQTEDPDATDATEGFFRHGRAAPGSVALHEILLVHVFGFLWLLQHTKGLENIRFGKISFPLVHHCHSEVKSSGRQRLTCLIFSATRHPTTILSLLMKR